MRLRHNLCRINQNCRMRSERTFVALVLGVCCAARPLGPDSPPDPLFTVIPFPANFSMPPPPPNATFNGTTNATLNALITRLPVDYISCSSHNDPRINRDEIDMLINKTLFEASAQTMAPTRSWSVWAATHDRLSTQLYICNYHNKWDAPFSVAEYRVIDEILDGECGFWGGYIHFNAWRMSIGRDPTNPDGSFRSECGYGYKPRPPPQLSADRTIKV